MQYLKLVRNIVFFKQQEIAMFLPTLILLIASLSFIPIHGMDCQEHVPSPIMRTIRHRNSDELDIKKNAWIAFEIVRNHKKHKADQQQLLLAYNKLRKVFNYNVSTTIDKEWLRSIENALTLVIENPHVLDFAHKKRHKKTKCIIL